MTIRHLSQSDLSERWTISPRTLERWRWAGCGPRYLKIGGRVVYRLEDIEAYENTQAFNNKAEFAAARGGDYGR
jgi:predicted site-specific integrase-resolvase